MQFGRYEHTACLPFSSRHSAAIGSGPHSYTTDKRTAVLKLFFNFIILQHYRFMLTYASNIILNPHLYSIILDFYTMILVMCIGLSVIIGSMWHTPVCASLISSAWPLNSVNYTCIYRPCPVVSIPAFLCVIFLLQSELPIKRLAVLLLLFFLPSVDMFPREFKN